MKKLLLLAFLLTSLAPAPLFGGIENTLEELLEQAKKFQLLMQDWKPIKIACISFFGLFVAMNRFKSCSNHYAKEKNLPFYKRHKTNFAGLTCLCGVGMILLSSKIITYGDRFSQNYMP